MYNRGIRNTGFIEYLNVDYSSFKSFTSVDDFLKIKQCEMLFVVWFIS